MKTENTTRPLAERITQGRASHGHHFIGEPGCGAGVGIFNALEVKCICTVHDSPKHYPNEDPTTIPNAELIEEAFNVTHETGRTPRQLADERAELIASLKRSQELLEVAYSHTRTGSQLWEHFPLINTHNLELLARITP